MEAVIFLSIIIALFSILVSCFAIRRVKKQIAEITDALIDVKNGNGNRRILSATNELVAPLAYEINEIVVSYESRLSTVRQTEETNRQLMTSLSHDVRTPLTTLIGYLDAAHKGIVTGKDRDDYIETARRKAHDLKEYIDVLFDWFKLNSNEFAMDINIVEAAELTRNILIDWIPIFEDMEKETTGTVISVTKQWWLKVNRKPVRTHAMDGAAFPHIIKVKYTIGVKDYTCQKWIGAGNKIPDKGTTIKVIYCEDKPSKARIEL